MIANYILWGKNDDGNSVVDDGFVEIETRNKTWTRAAPESLESLMESPTFNELSFQPLTALRAKKHQENFSREEALSRATGILLDTFKDLFQRIDTLDYQIRYYEFTHNKRQNPPPETLSSKFSDETRAKLEDTTDSWTQWAYLKRRHLLVELRREQFTLRDSYAPPLQLAPSLDPVEPEPAPTFENDLPVFPLGLFNESKEAAILFRPREQLNPESFQNEDELRALSKIIWKKQKDFDERPEKFFDFRDLEHVYQLFQKLQELEDTQIDIQTNFLIKTLQYYVGLAEISEAQKEILDMKIHKVKNQEIADKINAKFNKGYTANYISTIFRQKIIPRINEAADLHHRILQNVFFEEEFKKCTYCGQSLLRSTDFFVKKARAKDGFAARCKKCDKAVRDSKKEDKIKL